MKKIYANEITAYQCSHCKSIYRYNVEAEKCVKKHQEDKRLQNIWNKKHEEFEKERNLLRLTSTSIEEVMKNMIEIAKTKYNITIVLESYPDQLSEQANTHSSPIGIPVQWCNDKTRNYPSYSGRWVGSIRGKFPSKYKEFYQGFLDDEPNVHWIENLFLGLHFGSGSSGQDFRMDGHLYIQDFPSIQFFKRCGIHQFQENLK